jgi:multiple antibiotic resistance protein
MMELFISAFVTLFVVIDPPGCAAIFATLTGNATPAQRRAIALRAVAIATSILLFFGLLGEDLLKALGISLAAFRIAGGAMLFLIALEMVFERRTERRENRANELASEPEHEDISVFPMAIPLLSGPGSIASIMLLMARSEGLPQSLVVIGALVAVQLLSLLALFWAATLMRILGKRIEAMVSRLLGVLLGALAVQFIIDGISVSFNV